MAGLIGQHLLQPCKEGSVLQSRKPRYKISAEGHAAFRQQPQRPPGLACGATPSHAAQDPVVKALDAQGDAANPAPPGRRKQLSGQALRVGLQRHLGVWLQVGTDFLHNAGKLGAGKEAGGTSAKVHRLQPPQQSCITKRTQLGHQSHHVVPGHSPASSGSPTRAGTGCCHRQGKEITVGALGATIGNVDVEGGDGIKGWHVLGGA